MDIYTFSDYCHDHKILIYEQTNDLRHLRAMWDVYKDDYLEYCKINKYEYEIIP